MRKCPFKLYNVLRVLKASQMNHQNPDYQSAKTFFFFYLGVAKISHGGKNIRLSNKNL